MYDKYERSFGKITTHSKVMTINLKFFNEFIFLWMLKKKKWEMVDALNEVLKVLKSNSKVLSDKTFNIFIHPD